MGRFWRPALWEYPVALAWALVGWVSGERRRRVSEFCKVRGCRNLAPEPSIVCLAHGEEWGELWNFCGNGGCFNRTAKWESGTLYCAAHGGEDYAPRRASGGAECEREGCGAEAVAGGRWCRGCSQSQRDTADVCEVRGCEIKTDTFVHFCDAHGSAWGRAPGAGPEVFFGWLAGQRPLATPPPGPSAPRGLENGIGVNGLPADLAGAGVREALVGATAGLESVEGIGVPRALCAWTLPGGKWCNRERKRGEAYCEAHLDPARKALAEEREGCDWESAGIAENSPISDRCNWGYDGGEGEHSSCEETRRGGSVFCDCHHGPGYLALDAESRALLAAAPAGEGAE